MKLFRKLFCKHDYTCINSKIADGGRGKESVFKCNKCGKIKYFYCH